MRKETKTNLGKASAIIEAVEKSGQPSQFRNVCVVVSLASLTGKQVSVERLKETSRKWGGKGPKTSYWLSVFNVQEVGSGTILSAEEEKTALVKMSDVLRNPELLAWGDTEKVRQIREGFLGFVAHIDPVSPSEDPGHTLAIIPEEKAFTPLERLINRLGGHQGSHIIVDTCPPDGIPYTTRCSPEEILAKLRQPNTEATIHPIVRSRKR